MIKMTAVQFDALVLMIRTIARDEVNNPGHPPHDSDAVADMARELFVPVGDCDSCGAASGQKHDTVCTNVPSMRICPACATRGEHTSDCPDVKEPMPMVCVNVASHRYCTCAACKFNRSIKRTCPSCKAQKLVLNGQIWQCTGCGDIEQ
jgi:hypothetical protein